MRRYLTILAVSVVCGVHPSLLVAQEINFREIQSDVMDSPDVSIEPVYALDSRYQPSSLTNLVNLTDWDHRPYAEILDAYEDYADKVAKTADLLTLKAGHFMVGLPMVMRFKNVRRSKVQIFAAEVSRLGRERAHGLWRPKGGHIIPVTFAMGSKIRQALLAKDLRRVGRILKLDMDGAETRAHAPPITLDQAEHYFGPDAGERYKHYSALVQAADLYRDTAKAYHDTGRVPPARIAQFSHGLAASADNVDFDEAAAYFRSALKQLRGRFSELSADSTLILAEAAAVYHMQDGRIAAAELNVLLNSLAPIEKLALIETLIDCALLESSTPDDAIGFVYNLLLNRN